jgi:RNA polymerase sigma factor (sigma-70 family)
MEIAEVGAARSNAVALGLPDTFATEFERLYEHAYRAAYRLLGVQLEAERVAQEACARGGARWSRLTRRGAAEPWVVRIATELAIEQYQLRQRNQRRSAGVPGLVERLDRRRVALHRALNQLPPREREVVVLRYVADLNEADTAAAIGSSTRTVNRHATRGLAALRAALGEEHAP